MSSHRHVERVGGDLREHRLEPLPDRRRADIDRDLAVGFEHEPRVLARAGRRRLRGSSRRRCRGSGRRSACLAAPPSASSRSRRGSGRASCGSRRCRSRSPCLSGSTVASRLGHLVLRRSGCGGGTRRDRCRARPPRCRTAARGRNPPRSARARDRCRTASCWSSAARRRCGHAGCDRGRTAPARCCARRSRRWCGYRRRGRHAARPRSARMVPSRSQAISSSHSASRAWLVAMQVLAAVLDPLDRPAGRARRERDQEILRIEFAAHAEAAADVVLDHA